MDSAHAQITEEMESTIPKICIISGFDYDWNDWLTLAVVGHYNDKYTTSRWPENGASRVLINEGKYSKEAMVAKAMITWFQFLLNLAT